MEISKLTICRQDVIVVSDSDTQLIDLDSYKKKKHRRKIECIRNVKLIKSTVNRILPTCHRKSCKNSQLHHKQTSKNTKYRKRVAVPTEKDKKRATPIKNTLHKTDQNDDDINIGLNGKLYSPISIASTSNIYENISSCSFNIMSSDSDELEDLIKLTRKRMKDDNENFDICPFRKSICSTKTQDDYQNISSDDGVLDSSIHSMDTVLLYKDDIPSSSLNPECLNQVNCEENNNIDPMLLCRSPNMKTNELLHKKIDQNDEGNFSQLYEISGNVFMDHCVKTNII